MNTQAAQSFLKQQSLASSQSLQECVEHIIAKDKENVKKLQALEQIN